MTTQRIFEVIAKGDEADLSRLLDADPGLIHRRHTSTDLHHWTALQFAAAKGKLEACRLLVERGAEVYTIPINTYPPVMQAAWGKHQDVVDCFLKEIPEKADGTRGLGVIGLIS